MSEQSIFEELSEERKELQSKGDLPNWMTTIGWQIFKTKYLFGCETFEEQIERIVDTVGQKKYCPTNREYFKKRWKEMILSNHAYLATPVLSNTGTKRGMSVSCSGGVIEDSVWGFGDSRTENAVLTQEGFGTSSYLGDIRERGSPISRGGTANGVLPVFEDMVKMAENISQGGVRRGAWAGYLPLEHGDFWEVVEFVKNNPEGANVGWNIYDSTLDKLKSGCEDTIARFQRALNVKCITGKGYFYFPDKVNRASPEAYKVNKLSSKASNLCVAPNTKILTKEGYKTISTLKDQELEVWNGKEFSQVVVRKTSDKSKLLTVVTDSGQTLECTEYHKFYIQENYSKKSIKEVRAKDLKEGDKLIKFDLPVINGSKELHKAYQNGFYTGDGCQVNGKSRIYLYHEKRSLEKMFDLQQRNDQPKLKRVYGYEEGLERKYFVPGASFTVASRLSWLAGWLDADGCIYRNGKNEQVVGASVEHNFLQDVQLMLQTLGVNSKIQLQREAGEQLLPRNDGSGKLGVFYCRSVFRLIINSNGLFKLMELGINFNRLKAVLRKPQREATHFIKVTSIEHLGHESETYCFTEPKRNMGMFNGILTGNCTEITLHSDLDHSFSCVLSGLVAVTYDEWKDTDAIYCMTVFLDCLVSLFLDEAKGVQGLEKIIRGTEKGRAIGLGITGYHSYLQSKMLPFGSLEAQMINMKLFKQLHDESLRASKWMAKDWGEPEWCKGLGVRNTHRTAMAPNVSSAGIFGSWSQGVGVWYGNVYN